MQTFLPYADFSKSAAALDNQRLGNQCYREGLTLLNGGWTNHPASTMWRGYEQALAKYCLACALEMEKRDAWKIEVTEYWRLFFLEKIRELPDTGMPPWLGDRRVHLSHQSNLNRKSKYYHFDVPNDLPYYWP